MTELLDRFQRPPKLVMQEPDLEEILMEILRQRAGGTAETDRAAGSAAPGVSPEEKTGGGL